MWQSSGFVLGVVVCLAATMRAVAAFGNDTAALETLYSPVPCVNVSRYLHADHATWTAFLRKQPGFQSKMSALPASPPAAPGNCTVASVIRWATRGQWKAISAAAQAPVYRAFVAAYGADPPLTSYPSGFGLDRAVESNFAAATAPAASGQALHTLRWTVDCARRPALVAAINATVAPVFAAHGHATLLRTQVLVDPQHTAGDCSVWSNSLWTSAAAWAAVPASQVTAAVDAVVSGQGLRSQPTPMSHAGLHVAIYADGA